jgi:isochorismate synthase
MKKNNSIREKLQLLIDRNTSRGYPFAIYRMPNTEDIKIVAQNSADLFYISSLSEIVGEEGFLFAPFIESEKLRTVFIRPDHTDFDFLQGNDTFLHSQPYAKRKVRIMSKKIFRLYVQRAKRKIRKGKFEKIVTARAIKINKPENFSEVDFFLKVCNTYEWSFVSLVYIPQTGLWLGASPELLLGFTNGVFTTYSLAATRSKQKRRKRKIHWSEKEKKEQQMVSDYIEKVLREHPKIKLMLAGPETVEAGNIIHLRTTFTIENIPHFYWTELVEALHPTPAVCGYPKEEALHFIADHEGPNRAYYCGYLGPVNIGEHIHLFVNLRCMEIQNKKLVIHVGCGITEESDSKKEWEETKLKSQTLLNLLK